MISRSVYSLLLLLCAIAVPAADLARTKVTGKIIDNNGLPINQHPVVIRNPSTGAKYYSITDTGGNYYFNELPTGTYQVASVLDSTVETTVTISKNAKPVTVNSPKYGKNASPLRLGTAYHSTGKKYANGKAKYLFDLWLEGSAALLQSIASVHYDLIYEPNPLAMTSTNPNDKFTVHYEGWGCYENVTAAITYKNDDKDFIRGNMCTTLGWN